MSKTIFKMRTMVKTVAILAVSTMMFASCEPAEDDPTPDPGTEQDANFVAFTFDGIDGVAEIDKDELTVTAQAKETVDLADITAGFTLSTGATATVDGTQQVSGTTANDFNDPVTYTITSGDGETTLDWTVTIIKEMPNDEDDEGDDDEDEFKDWSLPENLKVTVQWSDYESDYEVRYNIVTKIGENYHSAHKPGTYETLMQYLGDERWSWWHRPDVTFDEWTYGDPFHFYESREAVNGRLGGRDFMYCLVSQRAVISISEITGVDTILGREVTVREGIFGKFWMDDEYNVCLKAEMDAGDTQVYFEVTQWDETAEDLPEGVVLPEEEE